MEDARLEYKMGWNPERILHTICAFANDIDGWSGGYIIVGVDMESGLPEVVGLDRASVDGMQKELVSMTNLIEPRYMPAVVIRNNQLVTGIYRNVRIGEYFKELGLAESRFTGIPRAVESLKENGSSPLRIVTDPSRTYFGAILEIHPDFTTEVENTADAPIDERIVSILGAEGCMRVLDLSLRLGYKEINSTVRSAIGRLMAEGTVEYLYPDAPRSPKQRVRLASERRSRHRSGSFRSKVGGISNLLYENEYRFD